MKLPKLTPEIWTVILGMMATSVLFVGLWPDLGLNLVGEALGVAFTILVVDELLKRRERERLRPILLTAHGDAHAIARDALRLVIKTAESTLPANAAAEIRDCSRVSTLAERLDNVPLDSLANVMGFVDALRVNYIPLRRHLAEEVERLRLASEQFTVRYAAFVEPELAAAVAAIEKATFVAARHIIMAARSFPPSAWVDLAKRAEKVLEITGREGYVQNPQFPAAAIASLADLLEASPTQSSSAPFRPTA